MGYRYGEGVALVNLGEAYSTSSRDRGGHRLLAAGPRTFAEINFPHGVGYALHNLGRCYLFLGRDAEALECLRQALAMPPGHG